MAALVSRGPERKKLDHRLDGPATLTLSGIRKQFGGVVALEDVDLTVAPGEAVAVIGPNGAGKSTLLKITSGMLRPSAGSVRLGDLHLDGLPPHSVVAHGVALANQIPQPFRNLSVAENVLVAALSHRREGGRALVASVLEEVGLSRRAGDQASALGLLDLKRLELARALATRAKVLLLDEVAAGLVGPELDELIAVVARLHAAGRTLLVVEHVERVVSSLVTRVVVLNWGKIIAEGTPAEIAADPQVREVYLGKRDARGLGATRPAGAREAVSAEAHETATPLLELRGIRAGYGTLTVLHDVDIRIGAGQIVAVLGANGAGKSTLAAAISGQLRLRQGTVALDGRSIDRLPAYRRARLGIAHCPEGRQVFAELTVAENLSLAVPWRVPRREVTSRRNAVERIFPALAARMGQRAGSLSGGEQQMLAIGRALMVQPRLLLCDEVSLGLAPIVVDNLYEALLKVNDAGVALVLIEQDVHRSLAVASWAYVLDRGQVTYSGLPTALLADELLTASYFGDDGGTNEAAVSVRSDAAEGHPGNQVQPTHTIGGSS